MCVLDVSARPQHDKEKWSMIEIRENENAVRIVL